ncbi:hypothetical protein GE09DRAFT_1185118 [Coniochaeta sp. 2T2.1]|nr:hypothetical protein GE09DRAFT_1185118 [Coniochaeta sp. 2T2.1]
MSPAICVILQNHTQWGETSQHINPPDTRGIKDDPVQPRSRATYAQAKPASPPVQQLQARDPRPSSSAAYFPTMQISLNIVRALGLATTLVAVQAATTSHVTVQKIFDQGLNAPCFPHTCCQPYCHIEWKDDVYCKDGWSTTVGGTCLSSNELEDMGWADAGCGGMQYAWADGLLTFKAPDAADDLDLAFSGNLECEDPGANCDAATVCNVV